MELYIASFQLLARAVGEGVVCGIIPKERPTILGNNIFFLGEKNRTNVCTKRAWPDRKNKISHFLFWTRLKHRKDWTHHTWFATSHFIPRLALCYRSAAAFPNNHSCLQNHTDPQIKCPGVTIPLTWKVPWHKPQHMPLKMRVCSQKKQRMTWLHFYSRAMTRMSISITVYKFFPPICCQVVRSLFFVNVKMFTQSCPKIRAIHLLVPCVCQKRGTWRKFIARIFAQFLSWQS